MGHSMGGHGAFILHLKHSNTTYPFRVGTLTDRSIYASPQRGKSVYRLSG